MVRKSLMQWEAETIAWINIAMVIMCLPLFGVYAHQTLEGVQDIPKFIFEDSRGQEMVTTLIKFLVWVIMWTPMSVLLKVAASERNPTLLKAWNVLQVIVIFVVALHLLILPPANLIMVLAYVVTFSYFLISLWICENLIQEIKNQNSAFAQMNSNDEESSVILALNDSNNNSSNASPVNNNNVNEQIYSVMSVEMKKVLKPSV